MPRRQSKYSSKASVYSMIQVRNDPVTQLLTVLSIPLEMFLSKRSVLYTPKHSNEREEHPSAAQPALMLYICGNKDVLEAENGGI